MDRQYRGRSDRYRYGIKILVGVVWHSFVHGRVDDDVWRNDQDRVAVGCGSGALTHADITPGAAHVLNVELLAKAVR